MPAQIADAVAVASPGTSADRSGRSTPVCHHSGSPLPAALEAGAVASVMSLRCQHDGGMAGKMPAPSAFPDARAPIAAITRILARPEQAPRLVLRAAPAAAPATYGERQVGAEIDEQQPIAAVVDEAQQERVVAEQAPSRPAASPRRRSTGSVLRRRIDRGAAAAAAHCGRARDQSSTQRSNVSARAGSGKLASSARLGNCDRNSRRPSATSRARARGS